MKLEDITKLGDKELLKNIDEHRDSLGNLKLKISFNEEKNTALVKKTKKTIARMKTVLNERNRHDRKK